MNYVVTFGERELEVGLVARDDGLFDLIVDGRTLTADLRSAGGESLYSLILDQESYDVAVVRKGDMSQVTVRARELALRVEAFFNHVEERIESSLTQGMSMGLVRTCDASLTASLILGSVRGALRRLIKGEDKFDVPVVATQLIDFSLRGVISSSRL